MDNCWGRAGMFSFVFAALLLVFNWPVLSIPQGNALLGWIFAAWAVAIMLLGLAARGAGASCPPPPEQTHQIGQIGQTQADQAQAGPSQTNQNQAGQAHPASPQPAQAKPGAETRDV